MKKNDYSLSAIVRMRDSRIHMSSFMLLSIVDMLQNKSQSAYIGEIHGYYQTAHATKREAVRFGAKGPIGYTYNGVSSQLRVLRKRGLVVAKRDGRYMNYSLSNKGIALLDSVYA